MLRAGKSDLTGAIPKMCHTFSTSALSVGLNSNGGAVKRDPMIIREAKSRLPSYIDTRSERAGNALLWAILSPVAQRFFFTHCAIIVLAYGLETDAEWASPLALVLLASSYLVSWILLTIHYFKSP